MTAKIKINGWWWRGLLEAGRTGPFRRDNLACSHALTAHRAGAPYLVRCALRKLGDTLAGAVCILAFAATIPVTLASPATTAAPIERNNPVLPTAPAQHPDAAQKSATKDGAPVRDALLKEAELPAKESWRPMLRYLAELHGRSVLPAAGYFPHPFQTIGPGYQDGRVFGHIDLTHVRLDTLRASPTHVRNQLRNEFAGQQADGLIPGIVWFDDKGQPTWKNFKGFPPIWVVSAEAYVDHTGDTPFLRESLSVLVRQIGWFEAKRAIPSGGFCYLDQVEDTWESGMDEGIRYDVRPPERAAAVDACSHLYMLYDAATRWSQRLGEPTGKWAEKAATLKQFIQGKLWDEQTGFFYDAWVMADPAKRHLAFEGIWPVVVGAASPAQAKRVIDEHLLNPKEFYTPHPIATVALSDSKFELRMWRGPAWNCMTYWAARGLVRHGRTEAAHRLLEMAMDATAAQFEKTGSIWEFYHPLQGDQGLLRRKPSRNYPNREYLGHNPLFAMADLWRSTAPKN